MIDCNKNHCEQIKSFPFPQQREKFEGATPELLGYIFTAGTKIRNFTHTDEHIKALIAQKYNRSK